jgi:two-component system, cell cycle response regulator
VPWFGSYFEPLLSVAVATLNEDGTLIEANLGFLRLIKVEGQEPIGARMNRFFAQPDFSTLIRGQPAADGEIYHGLLTMGEYMGRSRSLRARVWRVSERIHLLAEYEIEELEELYDKVIELNRDYATAQHLLAQTNLKLQQREAQIVEMSLTDPLTGVGNRRRLDQALGIEIARANRTVGGLCAFMADLDHFKCVNDTHGHEAGDSVLATFGALLRKQTRPTDIVARFGGEEFVVLMPDIHLEKAVAAADRVRMAFAACPVEPLPVPVTASFGVAEWAAGERGDDLLRRIDQALYAAKRSGRNRVVVT